MILFIDEVALWVLGKLEERDNIPIVIDYAVGLRYCYVVVEGSSGRSMGVAITPIEDILGVRLELPSIPKIKALLNLVSSLNTLEKALGIALLNALSSYLLWVIGYRDGIDIYEGNIFNTMINIVKEPVVVIGNMQPLVKKLRDSGINDIVITERNPCIRCGLALSDAVTPRIISKAKTLIVTGATLVNDTIDYIISLTKSKSKIILVGPTASIHPKAALNLGIHAIASLTPIDIDSTIKTIKLGGGRWDYTKYCREYIAVMKGATP